MRCPKCQAEVPEGHKFCGSCGSRLGLACPQCGADNPPANQFCGACGKPLPWACSSCGAENPPANKFCGKCGAARAAPEKVSVEQLLGSMRSQVQRYVPENLAQRLEQAMREPSGARRNVTVLMADLTGFTSLSEALDPEEVTRIVNTWFERAVGIICEFEGFVDKFQGDLVMALFGAPVAVDRAPERALRVADKMIRTIAELNQEAHIQATGPLQIHVSINTGNVVAGEVGGGGEYQYTVIGDAVNVASRLVHVAEAGQVVVGEETYRRTQMVAEYQALDLVQVKGKAEPLLPYLLVRLLPPGETRPRASVMIGREKEMEVVLHAWQQACQGEGQIAGIGGEAGVGKSTLAEQFCQHVAEEATVLTSHCFSYASRVPYLPLTELLRTALSLAGEDGGLRESIQERLRGIDPELNEWAPYFGSLLGVPEDQAAVAHIDARQRREATFQGLRALIFALAAKRPLVLLMDDLHWADELTVDFLDALVPRIASRPILLLVLFRPDFAHQWVRRPNYSHIGLERLGPQESEALATVLVEQRHIPARFKSLLVERSEGNPLFMGEIARTIEEQSRAHVPEEEWQPGIPDTVEEILMVRIDGLPAQAKHVLQVASVVGRVATLAILHSLVEPGFPLRAAVEDLVQAELLREVGLEGDGTYEFEHHLVQEVAYSHLLMRDRERLHLQVARALRATLGRRTRRHYAVLAYHYERARAWEQTLRFAVLAALEAQSNYAHADTLSFADKAIHAARQLPRNAFSLAWEIPAHWAKAHVFRLRGEAGAASAASIRALQLTRQLGWPDKLGLAHYDIGFSYQASGDYEKAKQCFRAALQIWHKANMPEGELRGHVALGACYYYLGRHDLNQQHIESAMQIAEEVPWNVSVTAVMSGAYNNAGDLYHWLGHNSEALRYFGKALELARSATRREDLKAIAPPNKRGQAWALGNIGLVHASRAEFPQAFGCISQALELASLVEEHFFEGLLHTDMAHYLLLAGALEPALEHANEAIRLSNAIGQTESIARALLALACVKAEFNEQSEAFALASQATDYARSVGSQEVSGLAHRTTGLLLRQHLGALEHALGHLRVARQLFRLGRNFKQEAAASVCYGSVLVSLGRAQQAARTVERALVFLRQAESRYHIAEALATLAQAEAALGNQDQAETLFAEARAATEGVNCPPPIVAASRSDRPLADGAAAFPRGRATLGAGRKPYQCRRCLALHRSTAAGLPGRLGPAKHPAPSAAGVLSPASCGGLCLALRRLRLEGDGENGGTALGHTHRGLLWRVALHLHANSMLARDQARHQHRLRGHPNENLIKVDLRTGRPHHDPQATAFLDRPTRRRLRRRPRPQRGP